MNKTPKPELTALHIFAFTLFGLVLLFFIWLIFFMEYDTPPKVREIGEYEIYRTSQDFVEQRLKAPSTAEFADNATHIGGSEKDSIYDVKSYVDSQNSFGAHIRSNYYAKMKYKGGIWSDIRNWQILECVIE